MLEVRKEQVVNALLELGIDLGDGLLVHSAVQFLGKPLGGLEMYLQALREVIGTAGTLAVPAFNFGFAHGDRFDPEETPSNDMGAFSEYVRQLPEARRSPHPMQSIAIVGRNAEDIAGRDTLSAFDPGSAFERMLELDFKLLLLGADERAISLFHYSEQRANVPYRYWKEFTGEVNTTEGWKVTTYRMFVRDLGLNPQLTLDPVMELMQKRSDWRSIPLNYGQIRACRLRDFVDAADQVLANDPWSVVTNVRPRADGKLEILSPPEA
jgi:aminoglycoside N3'-acetyltransferase